MQRDQFPDDSLDPAPQPQKSGGKLGLIIALAVGGVLVLLCLPVLGVFGWLFMARSAPVAQEREANVQVAPNQGRAMVNMPEPPMRKYTRTEFETTFMGVNNTVLTEMLGNPPFRHDMDGLTVWTYENLTTDQKTGKMDARTELWLTPQGKVVRISY